MCVWMGIMYICIMNSHSFNCLSILSKYLYLILTQASFYRNTKEQETPQAGGYS